MLLVGRGRRGCGCVCGRISNDPSWRALACIYTCAGVRANRIGGRPSLERAIPPAATFKGESLPEKLFALQPSANAADANGVGSVPFRRMMLIARRRPTCDRLCTSRYYARRVHVCHCACRGCDSLPLCAQSASRVVGSCKMHVGSARKRTTL